jgi:hypothetical protein
MLLIPPFLTKLFLERKKILLLISLVTIPMILQNSNLFASFDSFVSFFHLMLLLIIIFCNFAFMLLFIVTITCLLLTSPMLYSNIDTTIQTCFVLTPINSTICTSNVFNLNVSNRAPNMELKTNFKLNNEDLKMKLKF